MKIKSLTKRYATALKEMFPIIKIEDGELPALYDAIIPDNCEIGINYCMSTKLAAFWDLDDVNKQVVIPLNEFWKIVIM